MGLFVVQLQDYHKTGKLVLTVGHTKIVEPGSELVSSPHKWERWDSPHHTILISEFFQTYCLITRV